MSTPRIAAIHDLSGYGRCSLTVAMPVLSAMGTQCCPLPTALLSTHTDGFPGFTFLDLTEEMERMMAHWQALSLQFDGIYSGFLGSERQISLVESFIHTFRRPGSFVVVDPVMGDHGAVYRTYTRALCDGMARLAACADVITPNRTEAALLLGIPYEALGEDLPSMTQAARQLSLGGRRSVVLTGVSAGEGMTGALCFDAADGQAVMAQARRAAGDFSGTGDLFSSVLTGGLARGLSLRDSAQLAADFVSACALRTQEAGLSRQAGVDFEPLLWQLAQQTHRDGAEV